MQLTIFINYILLCKLIILCCSILRSCFKGKENKKNFKGSDCSLYIYYSTWGFPGASNGKESACNTGDLGSVPEKGMTTYSSILAWRIPQTEKLGGLYGPWGRKELDITERPTLQKLLQYLGKYLTTVTKSLFQIRVYCFSYYKDNNQRLKKGRLS